MPRATQLIVGSTATRVPTATGHSGPASITLPPISCPMMKGNAASVTRVGEGPVSWLKRCRSLPQMPPTVTATRAHAGPGSSGSARSTRETGKSESARSNRAASMARAYDAGPNDHPASRLSLASAHLPFEHPERAQTRGVAEGPRLDDAAALLQRLEIADAGACQPGFAGVGDERVEAVGAEELGLAVVGRRGTHMGELVDGDLARQVLLPQVLERMTTSTVGAVGTHPRGPRPARERSGVVCVVHNHDSPGPEQRQRLAQPGPRLVLKGDAGARLRVRNETTRLRDHVGLGRYEHLVELLPHAHLGPAATCSLE